MSLTEILSLRFRRMSFAPAPRAAADRHRISKTLQCPVGLVTSTVDNSMKGPKSSSIYGRSR
jgi:hypothetical protein